MLKQLMTPADPADTPAPVLRAAQLMYIGAAVTTVTFILSLVSLGSLKSDIRTQEPKWTPAQVNSEFNTLAITIVISSVIGIGLWLTMARGTLNRRRWAQIISTILFVLYTLEAIVTLTTTVAAISVVFGVLTWLVGAGAVIMLWRPESKAYFAARLYMQGVVLTAVPTPFTPDGEVDTPAARQLLKFCAESTDGLLVAGTTGEFPALDDPERLELIDAALEVAGVDRVIAQVGAADARRAARLATGATRLGATTIAAITPFYNPVSPGELLDYYARIREAAPYADLYAYIFPERTGVRVPVDLFASLAQSVGLAGAKLSGSAARDVAACAAAAPEARVYSGDDTDLASVLNSGGAGVISARSAAYPEVFMGLASALAAGDAAAIASWQSFVSDIVAAGASIGRIKEALRLRGFGPLGSRMPVGWPAGPVAAQIEALVRRLTESAL